MLTQQLTLQQLVSNELSNISIERSGLICGGNIWCLVRIMSSIWIFQLVMSIIPLSFGGNVTPLSEPPVLRCHQCHSQTNSSCLQIGFNDTLFLEPCPPRKSGAPQFCRKIVQKIYARENLEVVIRRCGWIRQPEGEEPCYRRRNHDYTGMVCDCFTDGCNSAPSLTTSSAVIIIITMLLALSCS